MATNRLNDHYRDEENSSPLPTVDGTMSSGLVNLNRISTTDPSPEQCSPGQASRGPNNNAGEGRSVSDSARQYDFLHVSAEHEEAKCEGLSVLPSLRKVGVSSGAAAVSDVGQGGTDAFTSDVPEIDIGKPDSVPHEIPMAQIHSSLNSGVAENQAFDRIPPIATSSTTSAWTATDGIPGLRAYPDDDAFPKNQYIGDDFEDSVGSILHQGFHQNNPEDIEDHSELLEATQDEGSHDTHAIYEDIGLDRKYFDPDYFLQYHGLAPVHGFVQRNGSGTRSYQYIVTDHSDANNLETSSDQKKAANETTKKKTLKKAMKETTEANKSKDKSVSKTTKHKTAKKETTQATNDVAEKSQADSAKTPSVRQNVTNKPKKEKPVSFHEDENAWFTIFFEKMKGAITSGNNIEIPSESMTSRLFNSFFEGKVLQEADGKLLAPRAKRCNGTIYNHISKRGPVKLFGLHNEVLTLLKDSTGGELYVPVITEEDIQRYRSDGAVILDDINDKAKNQALTLSSKEIQFNKNLRNIANIKRKRDAQVAISSSTKQPSSPGQLAAPNPSSSPPSFTKKASATEKASTTKRSTGNSSSTKQLPSPPKPKKGGGKHSSSEDVPSSPTLLETPAARAIDAQATPEHAPESDFASSNDAGNDMEFSDGPLVPTDSGVNDSSFPVTKKTSSHIEPDPFWKQQMQVNRKRQLSAGAEHGFEDIADKDVTDDEQEGCPAKKAKGIA
ncbi:hypothetical protein P171DRAFT_516945 [Karstenula rhodostoma CBS 690.94]|uniref:Uncharacterized protein n=1 Tax=Karstenula rhodostoma CBS 690.94 TaxID=1392251 RepID=A0A9P4PUS9_9PLEO|nr:hypothetical protein P171DRAFT_516945 [Karstenula rhodostoma CBS 690.94]